MKRVVVPDGYTIVELMIVIAVTAVLFLMAAIAISGRQQQVEVLEATRNFQRSIELMASEVTNGYFPSTDGINCTKPGGSLIISNVPAGKQGTHTDCVFMGKIIQFRPGFDSQRIINVAGSRVNSSGNIVDKFADATPVAVPQLDQSLNTPNLFVTNAWLKQTKTDTPEPIGAIGYFTRFPEDLSGGVQEASNVNLIALYPTNLTNNSLAIDNAIKGKLPGYTIPGKGVNPFEVVVCFEYHGPSAIVPAIVQYSTVGRKTYSETFIGDDQIFKFQIFKGWTYCT